MFDSLFGEGSYGLRFIIAFIVVLALIAVVAWLVRRFGGERLGNAATRGRQPRLAVIDAATVDGRRRLVLIRRDNVEHLLIIGGPTDVVVEQNIVRAVGGQRDVPAARAPAAPDAMPRPLSEGSMWPLQPEPAPRMDQPPPPPPRVEPIPRLDAPPRMEAAPRIEAAPRPEQRMEPAPRPQRQPPPPPPPPVIVEEEMQMQWSAEPEPPPLPPPQRERRPRTVDPLAGLAEELSRVPVAPEPSAATEPPRQPLRREPRAPRPQSDARTAAPPPPAAAPASATAPEPQFNSTADQNLAEMAHRLEAALRRPAKADDARPAPFAAKAAPEPAQESDMDRRMEDMGMEEAPPPPPARAPTPPDAVRPPRAAAAGRPDAKPAPQKSLYDSLEQEMASLLGRPSGKT